MQSEVESGTENEDVLMDMKLELDDWQDLDAIVDLLKPLKDATLALESSDSPTAHKSGRIMIRLMYKAHASLVR